MYGVHLQSAQFRSKGVNKGHQTSQGHHDHLKTLDPVHEDMERLLLAWLRDKELAGDTITEGDHLREGVYHS